MTLGLGSCMYIHTEHWPGRALALVLPHSVNPAEDLVVDDHQADENHKVVEHHHQSISGNKALEVNMVLMDCLESGDSQVTLKCIT